MNVKGFEFSLLGTPDTFTLSENKLENYIQQGFIQYTSSGTVTVKGSALNTVSSIMGRQRPSCLKQQTAQTILDDSKIEDPEPEKTGWKKETPELPATNSTNMVCHFCGGPTVPMFGRQRFCLKCNK